VSSVLCKDRLRSASIKLDTPGSGRGVELGTSLTVWPVGFYKDEKRGDLWCFHGLQALRSEALGVGLRLRYHTKNQ
jgi:hypothetical protein